MAWQCATWVGRTKKKFTVESCDVKIIQRKTRVKDRKRLSTFQREILLFTLQIEGTKANTDESDNNRSFFIQMLSTFLRRDPAYAEA